MHLTGEQRIPEKTWRLAAARTVAALALLGAALAAPAQTTSTTLRHLNSDEFNKVAALQDDSVLNFVIFGDSEGNKPVFSEILKQAEKEQNIAFAVHLGDMVPQGTEAAYKDFLDQLKDFKLPMLATIGGHDLGANNDQSLYRQIFGKPYFSFQIGQSGFYFVDDSTPGALDAKQLAWLQNALDQSFALTNRIVFLHKPLVDPRVNGTKGLPPALVDKLLEIFKHGNVSLIIAADVHARYGGFWGGIRYTICGGGGAPLEGDSMVSNFHHYMVVHVVSNRIVTDVRKVTVPGAGNKTAK